MRLSIFLISILFCSVGFAQSSVPAVGLITIDGKKINSSELSNEGGPVIIICWASWCKTSKTMLDNLSDLYDDWIDDHNVKIYAISYDDQRSVSKVKPLVRSSGWEFEVLLDKNADFKRAMGVNQCPFIALYDKNMKLIISRTGYSPGDEDIIEAELEKLN